MANSRSRASKRSSSRRSSKRSRSGSRSRSGYLSAAEAAQVRKEVRRQLSRTPRRSSRRSASSSSRGRSSYGHHHHALLSSLGFAPRADATMGYLTSIMSGLNIAPSLYADAAKRVLASLGISSGDDAMSQLLKALRESATGGSASLAGLLGSSTATPLAASSVTGTVGGISFSKGSVGGGLSGLGLSGLDLASVGLPGGGLGGRIAIKQDHRGRFYLCPARQEHIYFTAYHPYDYIKIKVDSRGDDYYRCLRDNRRIYLV